MPSVPRYTPGRVQQAGIPSVRPVQAPLEAFGGGGAAEGVFRQARAAAQDATSIAQQQAEKEKRERERAEQEQRQNANRIRMYEETRAFNEWSRVNLYDGKTGALSKRGKDAFGTFDEVQKSYDKFKAERRKGLATEEQRIAFQGLDLEYEDHWKRRITEHINVQSRVAEEADRRRAARRGHRAALHRKAHAGAERAVVGAAFEGRGIRRLLGRGHARGHALRDVRLHRGEDAERGSEAPASEAV